MTGRHAAMLAALLRDKTVDPIVVTSDPAEFLRACGEDDLNGLIAWLKANPDKATAGTGGAGGASHVAGIYLQKETTAAFQFVYYRGLGPAMQDLIAGHIDFLIDYSANSLPQVRAGAIKAFAVTARVR